jgi:hypothetical protein
MLADAQPSCHGVNTPCHLPVRERIVAFMSYQSVNPYNGKVLKTLMIGNISGVSAVNRRPAIGHAAATATDGRSVRAVVAGRVGVRSHKNPGAKRPGAHKPQREPLTCSTSFDCY